MFSFFFFFSSRRRHTRLQGDWSSDVCSSDLNQYFYAVDPVFRMADRPPFRPSGGYGGLNLLAALSKRFSGFWIGGFAEWDKVGGARFAGNPPFKGRGNSHRGLPHTLDLGGRDL